ncbi:MAG: lyase family protein, partial [Gemmobacter sp.]
RARALRAELARVQVGGASGLRDLPDGKGEAVAAAVAQALGLGVTAVWHADRSAMVGLGHWFTLVAGAMGKIGQDVALMAQQGVDEITLAGGGGSSAMAHKQNPILAETMVALARHVAGLQGTLAQAMIHEQERSGAAWPLEWLTLPAMAEATGATLRHTARLIASVTRMGTPG